MDAGEEGAVVRVGLEEREVEFAAFLQRAAEGEDGFRGRGRGRGGDADVLSKIRLSKVSVRVFALRYGIVKMAAPNCLFSRRRYGDE